MPFATAMTEYPRTRIPRSTYMSDWQFHTHRRPVAQARRSRFGDCICVLDCIGLRNRPRRRSARSRTRDRLRENRYDKRGTWQETRSRSHNAKPSWTTFLGRLQSLRRHPMSDQQSQSGAASPVVARRPPSRPPRPQPNAGPFEADDCIAGCQVTADPSVRLEALACRWAVDHMRARPAGQWPRERTRTTNGRPLCKSSISRSTHQSMPGLGSAARSQRFDLPGSSRRCFRPRPSPPQPTFQAQMKRTCYRFLRPSP